MSANSGGFILPPTYRQKEWGVTQIFGGLDPTTPVRTLLSGNSIIDLTTDEMINQGEEAIKAAGQAIQPKLLFVAFSDVGKVDVLELDTGSRVATIDVPDVRVVAGYWRQ